MPSLLIIEPNPDIGTSLAELFQSEGYMVSLLTNIDVLLSRTNFSDYNLIIAATDENCDLNKHIAHRRKTGEIPTPVYILACYCVMHNEPRYRELGIDEIQVKPLDFDILLSNVKRMTREA